MNATEQWYKENHLRIVDGYDRVDYESVKFTLYHGDKEKKSRDATYLPDFWCVHRTGEIHIHEVKGFCDEADRLKVKLAAEKFPELRWFLVQISGFRIKKIEEF